MIHHTSPSLPEPPPAVVDTVARLTRPRTRRWRLSNHTLTAKP